MAVFKFIGNGKSDPEKITAYGIAFLKGEEVEVEDKVAVAKLRGNSHFEEVEREEEPAADTDGNGYLKKAEIIAALEERGIEFDPSAKRDALLELLNGDENGTQE